MSENFLELTEDEFDEFKPIPCPTGEGGYNGCMIQNYYDANVWSKIQAAAKQNRVWTVIDTDNEDSWAIGEGIHIVNRFGYIITEKAYDPTKSYFINLDFS